MTLSYHRLTPQHIPQILDLDQRTYPAAFSITAEEYHYYLAWGEIKGTNHSIGVFDGDELIGYVVMILHPSLSNSGEQIALVFSIAVHRQYRRKVVEPLLARLLREALICGYSIEGRWREKTSYRMILRHWRVFLQHGFRITQLLESDPFDNERMIQIRFDHIFARDQLVWHTYQALTRVERTRRMLGALPRRVFAKRVSACPLRPAQHGCAG